MTLTEQSAPASSSPGLAALGAGLSDEDAPLVGRPTDDQPAAVGAVAIGIRSGWPWWLLRWWRFRLWRSEVVSDRRVGVGNALDAFEAVFPSVMSQKPHSWALGTRTGGSGAAIRRISEPRLRTKPWSMPPWGTRSVRLP